MSLVNMFGNTIPAAAVGGTLLQDSFTDADSTLLTAHTPDIGSAWVNHQGTMQIISNRAEYLSFGTGANSPCLVKNDVGTRNWYAEVTINASTAQCGISIPLTGDNKLILYAGATSGGKAKGQIYDVISGAYNLRISSASDEIGPWLLKCQAYEYEYKVKLGGTELISWVDVSEKYTGTFMGIETLTTKLGQFDDLIVIPSDGTQL